MPGMDLGRRYTRAPIAEAIVEFHVQGGPDLSMDALMTLDLGDAFEAPRAIYHLDGDFEFVDGKMERTETREDQLMFVAERGDGQRAVQYGPSIFAFTWRDKYEGWPTFLSEAETVWLAYRAIADPVSVAGVGVRFVNRIPLPHRGVEIKDYLRTSVDVPAQLPQGVRNLFVQMDLPIPQLDAEATITTALTPPDKEHAGGGLLLDIDVRCGFGMSATDDNFDGSLRETLGRLRYAKNFVFEACITDATRSLIH
jgi:uncharacterized protein (TIGR04255 family)